MRAATVVAGLAGGAVALAGCGGSDGTAVAPATGTTIAKVERTTLVSRTTVSGTLGYADARPLLNRLGAADAAGGTVTAVALEGSTVHRGGLLYRLDGEPVRLLYGATPAYRALAWGDDGPDVVQLERNLKALGYDPGDVDGTFDGDTAAAVRDWQADAGWAQTGEVALGQVAFLPGPRRIGDVKLGQGALAAAAAEILETTAPRQVVDVDLDADEQQLARRGAAVTVSLPGGREVGGRISGVGSVAQAPPSDGGDSGGDDDASGEDDATIDVSVRLDPDARTGRLDGAPVSVGLAEDVSRDALAVPVTALLAVRGGGYAVEKRTPAGLERVAVRPGQFTNGLVAVTSERLREGDEVVVPDGEL